MALEAIEAREVAEASEVNEAEEVFKAWQGLLRLTYVNFLKTA